MQHRWAQHQAMAGVVWMERCGMGWQIVGAVCWQLSAGYQRLRSEGCRAQGGEVNIGRVDCAGQAKVVETAGARAYLVSTACRECERRALQHGAGALTGRCQVLPRAPPPAPPLAAIASALPAQPGCSTQRRRALPTATTLAIARHHHVGFKMQATPTSMVTAWTDCRLKLRCYLPRRCS